MLHKGKNNMGSWKSALKNKWNLSNNMTKMNRFLVELTKISNVFYAQSAGAVEYTDCTSAEG